MLTLRLILTFLALAIVNGIAAADVYIWTDEKGTVHIENYGKPHHVKKYQRLKEPRSQNRPENPSRPDPFAAAPVKDNPTETDPVPEGADALKALLKGYSQNQKEETDWIDIFLKGYNLFKQDSDKGKAVRLAPPQPKPPPEPLEKGRGGNWLTPRPE